MTTQVTDLRVAANRRMKVTIGALQHMARITNVEMARRTGINRTTYATRIDPNDSAEVSAPEVELIAAALGVSVGTLYLPVDQAVQQAIAEGLLTGEGSPTTQQVDTPPDLHEHPLGKAA